ncbi:MAG: adenosine kinase [Acidimicrobiia bacterium]|nr:adenosine kinase [Acidimicrobiia bacterium]
MGLERGAATMVESARAHAVYRRLGPGTEVSGGSAANTVAGVASFGGTPAYIGKVAADQLGGVFRHDLRAQGVAFDTRAADETEPTGRCLVIVSPDAQRTMCTHLGVAQRLGPEDVDPDVVAAARITYVEGFLWDEPSAKRAITRAFEVASRNSRKVALSLSDPFCVDRHREEFLTLIEEVDILFANEAEITSLFDTDFESAADEAAARCEFAALTRGAQGSLIRTNGSVFEIDAVGVDEVVDTTGAGDLYAAGVLWGLARGLGPRTCGELGAIAAAEVISHLGARPMVPLGELARQLTGD